MELNDCKKLGFGCMRFPKCGDAIDVEQVKKMFDIFMDAGFAYFDTAHVYHSGKSESVVRECLSERYPRDKFMLTTKLSVWNFEKEEDIVPLFEEQLRDTGVEYFDYYLMHAQDKEYYEKYKKCRAYEIAAELKAQGKIKHIGISFHDDAETLRRILSEQPAVEAVQIQFNYVDYLNPNVDGKGVYEVCREFGKDIIIMEPVKGGSLANPPDEAKAALAEAGDGSPASFAMRYAAGFEGVKMVLSGMSSIAQVEDNVATMKDFKPLSEKEMAAVEKARDIFVNLGRIECTACRYCTDGCPMNIAIPDIFSLYNSKVCYRNWGTEEEYDKLTKKGSKVCECIECGQCESACPQHLPIMSLLKKASEKYDNIEKK
ncbi:MAG: aldo/keto reductase [Clostridia bacterium]|nr:aldo/keto reductase [Clostridia bacterium]